MGTFLNSQQLNGYEYPPPSYEGTMDITSVQFHRYLDTPSFSLGQSEMVGSRHEHIDAGTNATVQQGVHATYQSFQELPIDPRVLKLDAEYRSQLNGAASVESAGSLLAAPVAAADGGTAQTIDAPVASNTYLGASFVSFPDEVTAQTIDAAVAGNMYAASSLVSAPLPAIALPPSTSPFLSASNLRSNPNNQNASISDQERKESMIGRLGGFTALGITPQGLPKTTSCGIATEKGALPNPENSGNRGRLRCFICRNGFHSMKAIRNHFNVCAQRYGNPSGVCFDADVSCNVVKELAELKRQADAQGIRYIRQKTRGGRR